MTLGQVVRDAAAALDGVTVDGTDIRIASRTIAVVGEDGSWAEFRLDPAVAAAARRTPDATESGRGPDWVRLAPRTVDPHATDRAVAWLASAARRGRTG